MDRRGRGAVRLDVVGVSFGAMLLGLMMLAAPSASAQCAEGRLVTDQTAGRCCWPGQQWNVAAARCEGAPRCPAERTAEGDACVPRQVSTLAPSGSQVATPPRYGAHYGEQPGGGPPQYQAPPPSGTGWGAPAPEPYMQRPQETTTSLTGLWATGLVMLVVSYVYSVVVGSIFLGSWSPQNSWSMYIPVAGGFIWPAIDNRSGSPAALLGIPGAGVQTLGLLFIAIGAAVRRTVPAPAMRGEISLEPRIAGGPGDLGLSLAWDL